MPHGVRESVYLPFAVKKKKKKKKKKLQWNWVTGAQITHKKTPRHHMG